MSTPEIARAFLLPEATLRAASGAREAEDFGSSDSLQVPPADRLPERLAAVQAVIYLIFNEGYVASSGADLVRNDLCAEAIRLGRVLCELLPSEPENIGLLSLMLLHDSRRNARDQTASSLLLKSRTAPCGMGPRLRKDEAGEKALRMGRAGPYQLQAAIAALHAQAHASAETDWPQIAPCTESCWSSIRLP